MPREGEIEIKEFPEIRVALVKRTGPINQIQEALGSLMSWVFQNGIQPQGPLMGIYYNSPKMVKPEELQWEVAVPIPDGIEGEGEIFIRVIPAGKVATVVHKGPYEQVGPIYGEVFAFIGQQGLSPTGPPMEVYLNDPSQVSPEEILTEVRFPVAAGT